MTAIRDRTVTASAAVTAGGWPSRSLRSAVRMTVARSVMLRRPARLRAALTCARVSFAARAGSGALPSSSSVSGASAITGSRLELGLGLVSLCD